MYLAFGKNIALIFAGCMVCVANIKVMANENVLSLELKSSIYVQQDVIKLSDIAKLPTLADQQRQVLENLQVGIAPRVGYPEHKNRAELENLLKRHAQLREVKLQWSGANVISIRRSGQWLPAEFLFSSIQQQLERAFAENCRKLVIRPASTIRSVEVPTGQVDVQIRGLPSLRLRPRQSIWLDIAVAGRVYRAVQVPVTIDGYCQLFQASRDLGIREILQDGDLIESEIAIAQLQADVAYAKNHIKHQRLNRALKKGEVLRESDVTLHDEIATGDVVKLIIKNAGIVIEANAIAQENAKSGATIKLKLENNGETVLAKVVASGLAKIEGSKP